MRLGFSYLCVWPDLTPPSLCAPEALSLAALPAGWRKHQPRDTETGSEKDPGLLMMTAGARWNDKTGKQTACEMHTCLQQWHDSWKWSEGEYCVDVEMQDPGETRTRWQRPEEKEEEELRKCGCCTKEGEVHCRDRNKSKHGAESCNPWFEEL